MSEEAAIAMAIADLTTMKRQLEEIVQLSVKLAHAHERIGYLERTQAHAEAKTLILEAQLGGWEAACAAQVQAARIYLDATARTIHTAPQLAARGRLETAIDSNAGELLLKRLAQLEQAVRQAGHAVDCALRYGGACSCRMQLVRR